MTAVMLHSPVARLPLVKPVELPPIPAVKPLVSYAKKYDAYQRSKRMQPVYYLIGLISVCFIGAASVLTLEICRPEGYNSQAANTIIGFLVPSAIAMVAALRSAANGQGQVHIQDTLQEAKAQAEVAATNANEAKIFAASANLKVEQALSESGILRKSKSTSIHGEYPKDHSKG